AKHIAIPNAKRLASAIGEAQFDKGEAARQKKASKKKYGTVEAATKTRHAKKAYRVAQQKRKTLTKLTKARDKKDVRRTFGLRDA
ncbi:hypothetical protein LCGC14_2194550, partial [marine sediment metagenome]